MRLQVITRENFNSRIGLAGKEFFRIYIAGYGESTVGKSKIYHFELSRFDGQYQTVQVSRRTYYEWRKYQGPCYMWNDKEKRILYFVSDMVLDDRKERQPQMIIFGNNYPAEEEKSMTELEKLQSLIEKKHPKWDIKVTDEGIWLFNKRGRCVYDVVCHPGTYGYSEGLLEGWTGKRSEEPEGWLTAEEALPRFEKALKDKEKLLEEP